MENCNCSDTLSKVISEHGLLVNGVGSLLNKFDKLIELQDRTNFILSFVEKKLDRIIEKLER